MEIPTFTISQEENTVTFHIDAPNCNLAKLEVALNDDQFLFKCHPYFIRLTMPGRLVIDENYKGAFDEPTSKFTFTYGKKTPGEHFANLQIVPILVGPKPKPEAAPIPVQIVVADEDDSHIDLVQEQIEYDQGDYRFGFGQMIKHKYALGQNIFQYDGVFEVDPREASVGERHKMRIQLEQGKFNVDHYLADLWEKDTIKDLIEARSPYEDDEIDLTFEFTEKEKAVFIEISIEQQGLSQEQIIYGFHGLVELLFAYCYDKRINNFEDCSESSWNINKLAASLCWFDVFRTPKDSITSGFRRSLIYPLYRHFDLSYRVFEDLKCLLCLPERHLSRALIDMYYIFKESDKEILNQLFIKDYLSFIMRWDPDHWRSVVEDYLDFDIQKEDVGLNLEQIEESAMLCPAMAALSLQDGADSDDCSSLSEYTSDDSSTSDESST